ncbi:MAG TPA: DUF951 domain-containing protein [Ktedonobacterales bacterium]
MKYADLGLNDRVRLRKPHPCGSTDWRVVRLGADIGLKCEGCGRRVLLPRSEVERRIKQILSRGTVKPDQVVVVSEENDDERATPQ